MRRPNRSFSVFTTSKDVIDTACNFSLPPDWHLEKHSDNHVLWTRRRLTLKSRLIGIATLLVGVGLFFGGVFSCLVIGSQTGLLGVVVGALFAGSASFYLDLEFEHLDLRTSRNEKGETQVALRGSADPEINTLIEHVFISR